MESINFQIIYLLTCISALSKITDLVGPSKKFVLDFGLDWYVDWTVAEDIKPTEERGGLLSYFDM